MAQAWYDNAIDIPPYTLTNLSKEYFLHNSLESGNGYFYTNSSKEYLLATYPIRSTNLQVEIGVEQKILYAWGKGTTDIISVPLSGSTIIIKPRTFSDTFSFFDREKWSERTLGCASVSGNKLRLDDDSLYPECFITSHIKFTSDFSFQIKLENTNTKSGIVLSSKTNTINNPLYNSASVTGEPVIGVYALNGALYYGILNGSPASISFSVPIYIRIQGTFATKTIIISTSTDNINWTQRYSAVNPKINNVSPQWPLGLSISSLYTISGSYVEFSNFKINSGTYEYFQG